MRFYFPDLDDLPLPKAHRFPARKYRMLSQEVVRENIIRADELQPSPLIEREELERVHDAEYLQAVFAGTLGGPEQRRIGVPWSPLLLQRSRATVGGTLATARSALSAGLSGQLAGGTHHAHRDFGSGFCVFNDIAVAIASLRRDRLAQRFAIIDLDVHQGDGNAALLGSDPECLVADVFGAKNFPFRKVAANFEIALADNTDDEAYLKAVEQAIDAVTSFRPELMFFISGVDPLREDRLGRLDVTISGLAERDRLVCDACRQHAVPLAIVVGGGYAEPIELTVSAYAQTFRIARDVMGL